MGDQQFGIDTRKPRQAGGAGSALWHNMSAESGADRQSERAPPWVYDARRPASSHPFKSGMLVRNIAYAALSGDEDTLLAGADTRQRVPVRLSTRVDLISPGGAGRARPLSVGQRQRTRHLIELRSRCSRVSIPAATLLRRSRHRDEVRHREAQPGPSRSPRSARSPTAVLLEADHLRSCVGPSFDIPLEHGQRTCLHNPDNRDIEPIGVEASKPSRTEGFITADNKARAPARQLVQQETPEAFHLGRWAGLLWIEVAESSTGPEGCRIHRPETRRAVHRTGDPTTRKRCQDRRRVPQAR
jgi:hypothetical protein